MGKASKAKQQSSGYSSAQVQPPLPGEQELKLSADMLKMKIAGDGVEPGPPPGEKPMVHGVASCLHVGTVIYLTDLAQDSPYGDEPCEVQRFFADKKRWVVRLQHPRFEGKQILVAEENMSFGYCIMPANALAVASDRAVAARCRVVVDQAGCGRGLVAAVKVARGEVLFSEHPFLVTPAGGASWKWRSRWRAYLKMRMGAAQGNATMVRALEAFDALTEGDADAKRAGPLRGHATEIFADACKQMPPEAVSEEMRAAETERVLGVLCRFQANQFRFGNSAGPDKGPSAALYCYTSAMNHSCDPNIHLEPTGDLLRRPGAPAAEDGMAIARAARDIGAGEQLCISYAPKELVDWPLAKRRAYLLDKNGFVCRCARCVAEETAAGIDTSGAETVAANIESVSVDAAGEP